MNAPHQTAYLAAPGFEELLRNELTNVVQVYNRLMLTDAAPQPAYWAQNIWYEAQFFTVNSIGDAAKALRALQRNWWPYQYQLHRRTELIQEKLPYLSAKPLDFLAPIPTSPLGSWTLIDEHTLLAASHCSSPMPNGEWIFNEDKINPPSRAYLKLWELFTRFGIHPGPSDICLDLGASPGGWTWVLTRLAKKVIAFDKSPLDERLMKSARVSFIAKDAFKINLADYEEASWVLSDVICYPEKLFDFVTKLLHEFPDKKYVFSVKFQGSEKSDIISRFASLPGQLVHLSQNKHELTWFKV